MDKHLDYIDIAKGIGIILVVLSHTEHWELMYYTLAFFVPIFFFCSGFTSSQKEIYLSESFKRHAVKLLKPYLFFNILLLLFYQGFYLRAIFGIFYSRYSLYPLGTTPDIFHLFTIANYPMWFLTCMVIAYLLYDILIYYPKYQYFFLSLYLVLAVGTTYLPILLPWSLDTAPLMAVIMFCGHQTRIFFPNIFCCKKPHAIIILSVVFYVLLLPFCDGINISVRMYGSSVPTYLIAAITGCLALTFISRLLQGTFVGKGLQQIGIHSLTIFCLEIPFIILGKQLSDSLLKDLSPQKMAVITSLIESIIALVGGYLLSVLLHKNQYIRKIIY